jgi:tetratricopeptide (TPR) repeat protein
MENYYRNLGPEAFEFIPFGITNNPIIADVYSELVLSFLLDYLPHLDPKEPIYIMELATGVGSFSFYFIKHLMEKITYFSALRSFQIRFVMTDLPESNVAFWERNEALQFYVDNGVLDFAVYRPDTDKSFTLRKSGQTVTEGSIRNPLIVMNNYFFDSMKTHAFHVKDGQLFEIRYTFYRDLTQVSPDSPVKLADLKSSQELKPVSGDYFDNPKLNRILKDYCEQCPEARIIFPTNGINVIQHLEALCNSSLVILGSDKGFNNKNFMQRNAEEIEMVIHADAFSFMVNFDALRRYFIHSGGQCFLTQDRYLSLETIMGFILKEPQTPLERTYYYFREKVVKQNIIDNYFRLRSFFDADAHDPTKRDPDEIIDDFIGLLKLFHYDPILFGRNRQILTKAMLKRDPQPDDAVHDMLTEVRKNIYPIHVGTNQFLPIGLVYTDIWSFTDAIDTIEQAIRVYGPEADLFYYLGYACEGLGALEDALEAYESSLELVSPDREREINKLHQAISRVQSKLAQLEV